MNSQNSLQLALLDGETYQTEFKERIANLDREIVAFANGSGGSIFLGINDAGDVIGIEINNRLKSQVMDIARNCDPSIKAELIAHDTQNVLEIHVSEGTDKPYRCKDGFFLRIGPSSQKLKRDEIIAFMNTSGKIHFDEAINDAFQYPQDFSGDALNEFLKSCGIVTKLPYKDILLSLNVAEEVDDKLVFNNAGILFFARSPQKFHPESYVTAVRYQSLDRFSIIDKKDFMGSPTQQIENTLAFLLRHMQVEADFSLAGSDSLAARNDIYEYPLLALREAIVNAVAHRDYHYDGSHIYVHMYPDRIDIENPGGLYHGLTLENLGKRSIRRNRLIADLLHRSHYIERVGSGFDRMQHALADNNNPPLDVSATNFFNIRFYRRLKQTQAAELTVRQHRLYNIIQLKKTITRKQAAVALNVSGDTAIRELNNLLALGLVTKEGRGRATIYTALKNATP